MTSSPALAPNEGAIYVRQLTFTKTLTAPLNWKKQNWNLWLANKAIILSLWYYTSERSRSVLSVCILVWIWV